MSTRWNKLLLKLLAESGATLPAAQPSGTGPTKSNHYVFGERDLLSPNARGSHEVVPSKQYHLPLAAGPRK